MKNANHSHVLAPGFPYADCFVVHVRHVATRVGECDLKIEIGMHVQFLKSCMFEKKIRTNTGAETTKAQQTLLDRTVEGCKQYAKVSSTTSSTTAEDSLDDEDEDEVETEEMTEPRPRGQASPKGSLARLPEVIVIMLRTVLIALTAAFRTYLFPYIPEQLIEPVPPRTVEEAVANSKRAVDYLRVTSLESVSERRKNDVLREIGLIEKSIEKIKRIHAASIN